MPPALGVASVAPAGIGSIRKQERILAVNSPSDQREIIAFLSDPASYGTHVRSVERYETHGSIVFLAGDRAYKLKRAVKFPYMDYSTAALRRQMCMREFAINRRSAPMLYLDVRPLVRDETGSLRLGSEGEEEAALDWVVVMQRFDQGRLLENMRRSGRLTRALMRLIAEVVAAFHRDAEITPGFDSAAIIRAVIEENAALLKTHIGRPFDAGTVARYEQDALGLVSRVSPLLEQRRQQGHVRRCHGDLHLNNICMIGDRPVLFDAIEFSDAFACIDVLYDLAFLLMDLERHGLNDHANTLFNHYLELTDEYAGLGALPLFLSCRAALRAHTAIAAAEASKTGGAPEANPTDADALLEQALAYLAPPPPRLIAIGGVSGTGKSTLAREAAPALGAAPGAVILRSDVIRKQLMGVPESERLPDSAYAPAMSVEVFRRIARIAATTLASGYTVIADAVYGKEEERLEIEATARQAGARFDGLWLEAPQALLEQRIAGRYGDASDATIAVLRAQIQFVTIPENWLHISAAGAAAETLAQTRLALGVSS
jgi:aminoglycoside phosphotransferase family enzyme/predicted kinase